MEFADGSERESEYTQQYEAWRKRHPSAGGRVPARAPHADHHESKWDTLLRSFDAHTLRGSRKVKQLVQDGLPPRLRAQIYYTLSGAQKIVKAEEYSRLLALGDIPIYDVIERDVSRCYPDHVMFADAEGQGQRQLRRILRAYAHYNPKVGYCQGMGRLVGLFLIVGLPEENAFWVLAATIQNYIPRYYESDLAGLRVHTAVFESLLRERSPRLHAHLEEQGCDALMYATPWFMTVFTLSLPWETALRVWDWFIFRGTKVLFRVALAITDLSSAYLLGACPTITEQLGFLLHIPPSLVDTDALIAAAIRVKVSERHIERLTHAAALAASTPKS
ncbi:TBC-domain-containing protein [Martensiomyces pterosporus]|nr:TBC-domain-containing protein [Martensiomyces pterosporus]